MAINGSGVRDTARVFKISTLTVIGELKKSSNLKFVNEERFAQLEKTKLWSSFGSGKT